MQDVEVRGLRDQARERLKECADHLKEHDPTAVVQLERALAVAKIEALLSISGELALIRASLRDRGPM